MEIVMETKWRLSQ